MERFQAALAGAAFFILGTVDARGAAPGCLGFASVDGSGAQLLAGGTTGGSGGTTVTVSNQTDLISYAAQAGPYVIQVQGMVPLTPLGRMVDVESDKTILGLGCGSGILALSAAKRPISRWRRRRRGFPNRLCRTIRRKQETGSRRRPRRLLRAGASE